MSRTRKLAISFFAILSLYFGGLLIWETYQNIENKNLIEMAENITQTEIKDIKVLDTLYTVREKKNIKELLEINKDIKGFISIEGTNINEPFLQYDDNDYYLHRNLKGEKSKAGSIFLDEFNTDDLTDSLSYIYGHHSSNHKKFSDLIYYEDISFLKEYKEIVIHLYNHSELVYEIVGTGMLNPVTELYPNEVFTENDFEYYNDLLHKELEYMENIEKDDKLIMLVTCKANGDSSRRRVIVAKLKSRVYY